MNGILNLQRRFSYSPGKVNGGYPKDDHGAALSQRINLKPKQKKLTKNIPSIECYLALLLFTF